MALPTNIETLLAGQVSSGLAFFREHPTSTIADASTVLNVARATINRDIIKLRTQGRIAREGPTKGGR